MELKKSKKANLETWRGIFFFIGLLISLSMILFAFEWKTKAVKITETNNGIVIFEDYMTQVTQRDKPQPKVQLKMIIDKIKLVDNNTDLRQEVLVQESWMDEIPFELKNDEIEEYIPEPFYKFPEHPAEFPGDINKFLMDNIEYPEPVRKLNLQGIVYLHFQVDASGQVKNITVLRGVDPVIDEEAIRVLKKMPLWKPAIQGDRKVGTEMGLQIKFTLHD